MEDLPCVVGKHRKVSLSEQSHMSGIDNPNYHGHNTSELSLQHDREPTLTRKKSILRQNVSSSVPGSVENLHNLHRLELQPENGKIHTPLYRRKSAFSLSSSIKEKIEYSEQLER